MTEYFTVQVMQQMGQSRHCQDYDEVTQAVAALASFAGDISLHP